MLDNYATVVLLFYGTLRECGVKHALMREVAHPEWGNFRGVCPILNRAKELGGTNGYLRNRRCRGDASRCSGFALTPANAGFMLCCDKTHGTV